MTDGVTRSAVLLMALGEEAASEVLKRLEPKEVQEIIRAMSDLNTVSKENVAAAVLQFSDDTAKQNRLVPNTSAYVRAVLERALGQQKAGLLVDHAPGEGANAGIDTLRWMEGPAIAEILKAEHPQIIASVLAHLESRQAASALAQFGEELRDEVLTRIATLDGIHPGAMEDLNLVLNKVLASTTSAKRISVGGTKSTADILNFMGGIGKQFLEKITESHPEICSEISDLMFVFADLMALDNKSIQLILREISNDSLIIAMKGCEPDLRDKFLSNMSQRAAESVREDLESKGAVRLADVEAQQKDILKTVKRLAEEGQLQLPSAGEENAFV
jgi:flagellar motor switch protein FliG